MEAAGAGSDPDFPCGAVTIDDDFAAIGKLQFQHTSGLGLVVEIDVTTVKRPLHCVQCSIGLGIEFLLIHRVLPFFAFQVPV